MALIIGGHLRSGTTLLTALCHEHPDITLVWEFGLFVPLGKPYHAYTRHLLERWRRKRNWPLKKHLFMLRYLLQMHKYRHRKVIDLPAVEGTLLSMFPDTRIVGDKYPGYAFILDRLVEADGLSRLIIYRDYRNVANSVLKKVHTDWRNRPFATEMNTAGKIAKRWVQAISIMERHADKVHLIRYEELVNHPKEVLQVLGTWLGVEPQGFKHEKIHANSVGQYKQGLSHQEVADIMAIAGPTMERLGYEI